MDIWGKFERRPPCQTCNLDPLSALGDGSRSAGRGRRLWERRDGRAANSYDGNPIGNSFFGHFGVRFNAHPCVNPVVR